MFVCSHRETVIHRQVIPLFFLLQKNVEIKVWEMLSQVVNTSLARKVCDMLELVALTFLPRWNEVKGPMTQSQFDAKPLLCGENMDRW